MDIIKIVTDVVMKFAAAIPNLVGAILVAIFGYLISKIIGKSVSAILKKLGIDRLGDKLNDTDIFSNANIELKPSKMFGTIVYIILLLVFMMMATDILQMEAVSKMVGDIINYIPNLISALILLILGILLADFIKGVVQTACDSLGIPSGKIIATFIFYLVFLTMIISALSQAKIDTSLITSNMTVILGGVVGAFALGYGFAARDTMANFLASFYSKNKIQIGDIISLDNVKGEVVAIDGSSLTLDTGKSTVIIPLNKLTTEKVEIFKE
jgi:hypothetical protein